MAISETVILSKKKLNYLLTQQRLHELHWSEVCVIFPAQRSLGGGEVLLKSKEPVS